ncbi:MAG: radical SAM protein [Deltaproteobacteria bacterium]|nr:radical SAM protein [Deltaproteobacteria bacterium]
MEAVALKINEIFYSIQGESLLAGKPTVFVRTASCNLKCRWCDTQQTPWQGKRMEIDEILTEVKNYQTDYVCITGGEPLAQKGSVVLIDKLLASGYVVSLETNGSFSIKDVPRASIKVIDLKCPDSGESESIAWENFSLVAKQDQFKFVVASKGDFDWALKICEDYKLNEKCTVLFSPVYGQVKPADLAAWILSSHAKATLQLQLHKEIWGPDEKGV